MSLGTTLGVIAIEGLFGRLILTILWPTRRSATRLLRRWGVAHPTAAEQAQALTYLRRRRFWYPWLFLGLPAVLNGTGVLRDDQDGVWLFPAMLLIVPQRPHEIRSALIQPIRTRRHPCMSHRMC